MVTTALMSELSSDLLPQDVLNEHKAQQKPFLPLPYIETPLVPSLYLSERVGSQVMLKLEQVQPSGSFKSRGLGNLVYQTLLNGAPGTKFHFFASSGGNAGLATACAARTYFQKCTVCVPLSTPAMMVERIRKAGAEVVLHGKYIVDADRYLRETLIPSCKDEAVYCHPYDNELVWEGNSTLSDELVKQLGGIKPDAVVCSVGGGGMYNGLVQGFQKAGWKDVPIVAVETEGCAALNLSIKSGGTQVFIDNPCTIAKSLSTATVTRETIDYAMNLHPTHSLVVPDVEVAQACLQFASDHKLLVEAACGTALAPLYTGKIHELLPNLTPTSVIAVIVCGGSSVSWEILDQYAKEFSLSML